MPKMPPVLVAPDSFKGTLRADEVADAIARGLEAAGWEADRCPIADGGEGTLEVLLGALGGEVVEADPHDPLGRPLRARFALLRDGAVALVEAAAASGLGLVAEEERDAEAASTAGTGELIAAAIEAGAREVLVAVGGSATTDGGRGAIDVLRTARLGGEAAGRRRADGGGRARLTVLCDVRTPFERAAEVFAPQKGADPAAVRRLARRLDAFARELPRDPRGMAMGGAAGGLSGGLWAAFGARLVPGAAYVLDALGFDARMRASRAVVTGEGRLDPQTLAGKAVGEVAVRCRQNGVPCHAIVGERAIDAFDQRLLDLSTIAEAGTPADLTATGRRLGEALAAGEA
jgi:glycerate kinase